MKIIESEPELEGLHAFAKGTVPDLPPPECSMCHRRTGYMETDPKGCDCPQCRMTATLLNLSPLPYFIFRDKVYIAFSLCTPCGAFIEGKQGIKKYALLDRLEGRERELTIAAFSRGRAQFMEKQRLAYEKLHKPRKERSNYLSTFSESPGDLGSLSL